MTPKEKEEKLKVAFDVYEKFERDFNFTKDHTKSFAKLMWEIMQNRKAAYYDFRGKRKPVEIQDRNCFSKVTGLGPSTYDRIRGGSDDYIPSFRTFMTLCMVYDLDLSMVTVLRRTYGYDFNFRNRVHQAYVYLLVNCKGKSLSYCNKTLESLGINEKNYLGDGRIDEQEIENDVLGETNNT